ncbi:BspA family leucine-rich repeat surface protein [Maribacter hydrothermalis]|uniref:PKD domain-containing protein n=1 Tax=Maribacter hydrothermalis TaxID=1836467 RepID=A0A1B7Z8I2_9FLAO|nr:BspA family leucine-rich repeat surface protein [Maribacter hydrothermalis]APQ18984.1 hypothetical protein BTR34_17380 [Maribacter hydrothermalis]OBR39003.1 hypothetical protein A9200_04895 [Maribacter hydrothermalis]
MRTLLSCILFLCITLSYSQSEFITTWKTDNPGSTAPNSIVIPTYPGETYDYTVDWGDGTIESNLTDNAIHTYATPGIYSVAISGTFPRIYFNNSGDKEKLILVNQWGSTNWSSMEKAFSGCINLDVVATDTPNFLGVNDLSYLFNGCTSLVGNNSFSNWNTSNVNNMRAVFTDTDSFNQDIGSWDTSEVINMAELFKNSKSFNQDIGNWNISSVTNLAATFNGAILFNQNIGNWDVSSVEVFLGTFANAQNFNQNIGDWDVSAATDMAGMFSNAISFNQDIGRWDVSKVKRMINMFNFAISFNQNIGFWNVSNVTSMNSMFYNAQNFNQTLSYWNVSNVENMNSMFDRASNFDQNLGYWNISKVTDLEYMFSNAGLSTYNYDATLNGWAQLPILQSNLTFDAGNSRYCFSETSRNKLLNDLSWIINDAGKNLDCKPELFTTLWKTDNSGSSGDNQITIPTFSGEAYNYTVYWGDGTVSSNVTGNITHTYYEPGAYQVSIEGAFPRIYFNETGDREKILEVKQWGDVSWNSMESAFAGCSNLSVAANDVPNLSNTTSLKRMFLNCGYAFDFTRSREYRNFNGIENFNSWDVSTITDMSNMFDKSSFNQDISQWNVSNVTDISYIFYSSPFNFEVSNWDVSSVVNMQGVFGSSNFNKSVSSWDVSNVTNMDYMFNSTNFDQDISSWNVSNVTSMRNMLSQGSFNQDISSWNVSNVLDMSNIFDDNDLSRENYDKILIEWSLLPNLQNGIQLGAKDVQFCLGKDARDILTTIHNWNIIDQGENCEEERPFVTTWKTDNPGFSDNNQITIPTNPNKVYLYNVDWGDGTFDISVTKDITHTYVEPGTYQVSISGRFPHIYFNNSGEDYPHQAPKNTSDIEKIISIDQWGTNRWISMAFAFAGCSNLDVLATDIPDFSKDIDLSFMFYGCSSLKGNESMELWDLSDITMSTPSMFSGAIQFNQSLGNWDVSNIRYLDRMFENAISFNQNLENWDIGKVENMDAMFNGSGISIANYDRLLNAWSTLPSLVNNVNLGAADTNFCNSTEARQNLIDTYGWQITDAGNDCSGTYFITTWKTDNPGISADNQITIPTFPSETYDYSVNWGDGNIESNFIGDATHTYLTPGTYQVSISGVFPRIFFNNFDGTSSDSDKIISVDQWGDIEWTSMNNAFTNCTNLNVVAIDIPNLENVNSLGAMFRFCDSLIGNESFSKWQVKSINFFDFLFDGASQFNQYIGNWDVSNATNMSYMFNNATIFDQDITNWDISNVDHIGLMFANTKAFNQPIGNWNMSNLTSLQAIFAGASAFNQDISSWDVSNVTNMEGMFSGAISFNQDISNWDVSNVTTMNSMFPGAISFNSPLNSWDVSSVTDMTAMFDGATSFNRPLNNWNISNVTQISSMFVNATSFNQPLDNWDVSNVTSLAGMFLKASSFNQNLSNWDISNVTSIGGMFNQAISYDQNLGDWDVSKIINMDYLFNGIGLSLDNYDKTLTGWANLPSLQNNVVFDAANSKYCESENARQSIIDTFGWTINDFGKVPFCNEDNDLDGILDHKDSCLDTRPNVTVNDNGCEIIVANAILVYGASPTCPGEANGTIEISSNLINYGFNISIEGPVSFDYNEISLNNNLEVSNLTTGMYTVTIAIPDISYVQTYGIQINEVDTISGKRENLNTSAKTALYNVEGSYNYTVDVNGELKNYNFTSNGVNEIQLSDLGEINTISISGESDCQGKVTDSFAFTDGLIMYPTITTGEVFVEGCDESSTVLVYDLSGRLVFSKTLSPQDSNSIDIQALETGVYPMVIQSKENSKTFKIIKQ